MTLEAVRGIGEPNNFFHGEFLYNINNDLIPVLVSQCAGTGNF
jgi:hypothetical protein